MSERERDRFLELKALMLVLGASLGLAGMLTERSWLVWLGIAVIAAGILVRLIMRRKDPPCVD